ncbi:hypothetical protein BHE74_00059718 [Ensete ventricosum]|uniref:Uncharacterized protein n=1 Tax=Ensete ventricosum TaxID=4639 RepID=A0A445MM70_ENSVE|nr:hypothetical protein BHE74_00059718 [Ensete ventricosum]RZR75344.1 hypothetical protein BHM03_00055213 [Ensete ventricosum]
MEGPLYNVMIVAPPTQARVPTSFAIPSRRSNRTFSILLETCFGSYYGPRKQTSKENVQGTSPEGSSHDKGDGWDRVLDGGGEGGRGVVEPKQIESLVCSYTDSTYRKPRSVSSLSSIDRIRARNKRSYPHKARKKNWMRKESVIAGLSFLHRPTPN